MPRSVYEDKLLDVMRYVKMRLDRRGMRLQINSKDDIKRSILALDRDANHKGDERISFKFLDKVLATNNADRLVGKTIGRVGPVKKFKQTEGQRRETIPSTVRSRVEKYRGEGRDVYPVRDSYVVKNVLRRGKTSVIVFRDVKTGRFVTGKKIEE